MTSPEAQAATDMARYKYLLRVASPRTFEQVHVDAFARLSAEQREAVYRRLCHDLAEEGRPVSSDPEDLAHAAAWAQDDDPGYLLRVLRRPGEAPGAQPAHVAGRAGSDGTLYAASVLNIVAAAAAASAAAGETLEGFDASLEAAQVDPTFTVPRPERVEQRAPHPGEWKP